MRFVEMKFNYVFKNNNVVCAHLFRNYRDRTGSDDESYLYLCRDFPGPIGSRRLSIRFTSHKSLLGGPHSKNSLNSCQMFRKVFSNIINAMRRDVFIEFETDRLSALV